MQLLTCIHYMAVMLRHKCRNVDFFKKNISAIMSRMVIYFFPNKGQGEKLSFSLFVPHGLGQ